MAEVTGSSVSLFAMCVEAPLTSYDSNDFDYLYHAAYVFTYISLYWNRVVPGTQSHRTHSRATDGLHRHTCCRAVSARTARCTEQKKKPKIPYIYPEAIMVSVQRNSLWSSSYGMNFSSESSSTNRSVSPIGPVPSSSVRLWLPNVANTTLKPESSSLGTYSLFSTPKSPYQAPTPHVASRTAYSHSPPLPGPSDPLDSVLGTFPCARLRGLPMETCIEDVLVFFHGFVVLDIVIVPHPFNGPSEAFVVFSNLADFQVALQR